MTTVHLPRPSGRAAALADTLRGAFWVLALGLIAGYAFFAALGAFSPGDVIGVTALIGVLLAMWLVHAWIQSHHAHDVDADPRLRHSRERRGF